MPAPCYALYGLTVRSPLPLPAAEVTTTRADLSVRLCAPRTVPDQPPAGRLLAEHRLYNGLGHAHTATDTGYLLRYYRACDFHYHRAQRRIDVFPDPDMPAGYPAVLLAGSVLASLLELSGETVLHASAVASGDQAIAFVGRSGQGKTTLAALCCAAGAKLVTDDVLRLQDDDGLHCLGGLHELRLRPAAQQLNQLLASYTAGETADGRFAVRPPFANNPRLALRAVILPRPNRETDQLTMRRLEPRQALRALLASPRILGWRDHQIPAAQLEVLARVASRVPLYEADIPWGPPFVVRHAERMLERALAHAADNASAVAPQ